MNLVTVESFGPFSLPICSSIIFASRFSYITIISLLTMHQILKFLYIFKWKWIVSLNEVFFALFLTLDLIILSLLLTLALSFNNQSEVKSVEFYLCIGQYPTTKRSDSYLGTTKLSGDLIHLFSFLSFSTIIILTITIHFYAHKNYLLKHLKSFSQICCQSSLKNYLKSLIVIDENENFELNFKDTFVGSSLSITITLIAFGTLILSTTEKELKDLAYFNSYNGRCFIYGIKFIMAAVPSVFCLHWSF